jgi:hypothetical protein
MATASRDNPVAPLAPAVSSHAAVTQSADPLAPPPIEQAPRPC